MDTVLTVDPEEHIHDLEETNSIRETVEEVRIYIEHIKGSKITCRADLRFGVIPISDIEFENTKTPVVFIRCNNPIFKIMCMQTSKEWTMSKWLSSTHFPLKTNESETEMDKNITKTQASARFGITPADPFRLITGFLVGGLTNFLNLFKKSNEYLVAVVDQNAFETVCDEIYKNMAPFIQTQ